MSDGIFIKVKPFEEGIEISKFQGLKILEEASEAYQAYDLYIKTFFMFDEMSEEDLENSEISKEKVEEVLSGSAENFLTECADTIQAIVNLIYAISGKDKDTTIECINNAFKIINIKNEQRGFFGKETESDRSED